MSKYNVYLALLCAAGIGAGSLPHAAAQRVVQNHTSEEPSLALAWQWSGTPAQEHAACEGLSSIDSIDVVGCHNGELEFRVKAGQTVHLTTLNEKLAAVVPGTHFSLRTAHAMGVFELILPESYDASNDDTFLAALQGRRSVDSVEQTGPRHFTIHLVENQTFGFGQLMQIYVRALRQRGRIQIEDIVADLVFHPIGG